MALKFGELVGTLDLDDKPFQEGVDRSGSKLDGLVGIAKKAAIGIAAGMAAGAVASVVSFASFESSMNEVFTLLPGISKQGMDKMTGQVKDFSKEFGVLPDKVVPALYQSLSAGVPPGNVFEFLETAQQAAKGGVTDLTTAVDGISSVVNAYGDDVVSATQASDLMFTAVRLGKTNFQELSSSLFNVTPVASALGVQFGDVTAALAAMTSQGIPTSVATTQLRGLLVELSKEGTATSDVFKEIAGKSFKQFIAEGGNTQGALQLLEQHAKDTGVGVNDLFGSVEAGGAALALTGKGTETFTNALTGMQDSAGATQAAYTTMDQGLSASFDRIKAAGSVFLLEVGERVMPMAAAGAEALLGILLPALDAVGPAFSAGAEAAGKLASFIGSNQTPITIVGGLIAAVLIPHLVALGVAATVSAAKQVAAWVATQGKAVWAAVSHSGQVVAMVAGWVLLGAQATVHAAKVVAGWVATGAAAVGQAAVHVAQVGVMVAKWVFLGAQSLLHAGKVAAAWLIAMGPIGLLVAAAAGLVVAIVANWESIKGAVSGGVAAIGGFLGNAVQLFRELPGKITGAIGNIGDLLYGAGKSVIQGFINGIKSAIGGVKDTLGGITKSLTSWKGPPSKDAKILYGAGGLVLGGFIKGVDDQVANLKRHLGAVAGEAQRAFNPTFASTFAARGTAAGGGITGTGGNGGRVVIPLRTMRPGDLIDGRDLLAKLIDVQRSDGPLRLEIA